MLAQPVQQPPQWPAPQALGLRTPGRETLRACHYMWPVSTWRRDGLPAASWAAQMAGPQPPPAMPRRYWSWAASSSRRLRAEGAGAELPEDSRLLGPPPPLPDARAALLDLCRLVAVAALCLSAASAPMAGWPPASRAALAEGSAAAEAWAEAAVPVAASASAGAASSRRCRWRARQPRSLRPAFASMPGGRSPDGAGREIRMLARSCSASMMMIMRKTSTGDRLRMAVSTVTQPSRTTNTVSIAGLPLMTDTMPRTSMLRKNTSSTMFLSKMPKSRLSSAECAAPEAK
mmetsp:Transcript_7678/g.19719  ORF Transcript_7678/g.19719 Transcript_7678/m.19719 type:complete len:289 (+) Transcript_7678:103-969(+)